MQPIRITPRYALVLTYDIRPGVLERYYRFITNEFIMGLQERKIYMEEVWHVTYGDAPERQIEFFTEELAYIESLFASSDWSDLEKRLRDFTSNYKLQVLRYQGSFKIVRL